MCMKYYFAVALFALSACGEMQENIYRAQTEVQKEASVTLDKVQGYLQVPKYKKASPKEPPPSYCYRTGGDILCYKQPLPGQEDRLVGYQSTIAPEALVASKAKVREVKPMPPRVVKPVPASAPAPAAKQSDTVFVDMAPQVKPDDTATQTIPAASNTKKDKMTEGPRDLMPKQ